MKVEQFVVFFFYMILEFLVVSIPLVILVVST
jgi:hypothetical protein